MTPLHVAIIMDGNGRWAAARGLPRAAGHRAGADALRRVVETATPSPAIETLTAFAFSADNWRRPAGETRVLMGLFREYLRRERKRCREQGIRVAVVGRRDRLPAPLVEEIRVNEQATRSGRRLLLRIAVDYSSRETILRAIALGGTRPRSMASFARRLATLDGGPSVPPVDLLIRSGGEQRLSDFLLWECAYAELYFSPTMWPDFGAADLEAALDGFRSRERRFGGLPSASSAIQAGAA